MQGCSFVMTASLSSHISWKVFPLWSLQHGKQLCAWLPHTAACMPASKPLGTLVGSSHHRNAHIGAWEEARIAAPSPSPTPSWG